MVIAIEGLPGVGKTTTAALVARRLGARVLCETTANHPFLQSVYDEEQRDDLLVELAFLLLHAAPFRGLATDDVTVTDYSPVKDDLFALDVLEDPDYGIFQQTYAALYSDPRPDVVVYLRAPSAFCLARVRLRMLHDKARKFEVGMTIGRLERMRLLYEEHLGRLGREVVCLEIDPSMDIACVTDRVVRLLRPRLAAGAPSLRSQSRLALRAS